MGRSKRSGQGNAESTTDKVYCYFCDKEFPEEHILVQHQLSKHFRCEVCIQGGETSSGRCNTLHGLLIHYRKVHSIDLKTVPNAIEGRDNPHTNMQIYGSRNVPQEILAEWRLRSGAPPEPESTSTMSVMALPALLAQAQQMQLVGQAQLAKQPQLTLPKAPGLLGLQTPILSPALQLAKPPGAQELLQIAKQAALGKQPQLALPKTTSLLSLQMPVTSPVLQGAKLPGVQLFPQIAKQAQLVTQPQQDLPGSSAAPHAPKLPASQNWSQQVKDWMAMRQQEEENIPQEEEQAPPPLPPLPPLPDVDDAAQPFHDNGFSSQAIPKPSPNLEAMGFHGNGISSQAIPKPSPNFETMGFHGNGFSSQAIPKPSPNFEAMGFMPKLGASLPEVPSLQSMLRDSHRDAARAISDSAAQAISAANEAARLASAAPSGSVAAAPAQSRPRHGFDASRSRSRSRGRRSRSRSRGRRDHRTRESRRSRSRDTGHAQRNDVGHSQRSDPGHAQRSAPPPKPPPTDRSPPRESRTIEITGGIVASRLWLKKEMEKFGHVEVCHTGNRQNLEAEPPWVRFGKSSSAEAALNAINAGQVLLDGGILKAELRRAGLRPAALRQSTQRSDQDMEITSRDLVQDDRRRRERSSSRGRRRR